MGLDDDGGDDWVRPGEVRKADDAFEGRLATANGILVDNRTNLSLLVANGRDTLNHTRHTTRTFRYLFAPWTLFNNKNAGEKRTDANANDRGNVPSADKPASR